MWLQMGDYPNWIWWDRYQSCAQRRTSWIAEINQRSEKTLALAHLRLTTIKGMATISTWPIHNWKCSSTPFRKATLEKFKRFGTEELARIEEICLRHEKSANLEYEIFMRIREEVSKRAQGIAADSWCPARVWQSCCWNPAFDLDLNSEMIRELTFRKGAMLSLKRSWGPDLYSKYDSDGRRHQYPIDYRAKHERSQPTCVS